MPKRAILVKDGTCIFRPDLKYDDKSLISKLIYHKRDNQTKPVEVRMGEKLKELDPDGNFHCLFLEMYPLEESNATKEELEKCDPGFAHSPEVIKDHSVLNFRYCGKYTLHQFVKKNSKNKDQMCTLLLRLLNVINGIIIMSRNGVEHGDLHTKNILVSNDLNDKYCTKIIDFGRTHLIDSPQKALQNNLNHLFTNLCLTFRGRNSIIEENMEKMLVHVREINIDEDFEKLSVGIYEGYVIKIMSMCSEEKFKQMLVEYEK